MKLFTPGPVNIREEILEIGGQQHPYFRTKYFSEMNLETEKVLLDLIDCKKGKIVPLTASGTGAMDMVVSNIVDPRDHVMIINAGTFGHRWCDICDFYKIPYYEYRVPFGKNIDLNDLFKTIDQQNVTHLLMQATETSSGQSMPVKQIGDFLKARNVFFVVDAITAFLADEYSMDRFNVDVTVLSSQKGFAVPPGFAFLVLSEKAVDVAMKRESRSYYFNIKAYLEDMKRGQTPFSPSITLLAQINA
ncbi:MAG TPA: aminotransferase class V-fold PLP-dependent enzyme, partial [Spirochaetota bacterium]|nr:aminotransferase class V-fold PLP-dependent enzyme [Spirochaetota bacterium]